MKSFKEFIAPNVLEEAVVKPGIVLSYSRKSKVSGDKAESAFLAGRAALKRGQARVSDLLCMSNLAHASPTKEHDDDDDFQRITGRAA